MEQSVFTKIINGDIPCHKVYEDDYSFAFMDIDPIQPGMVLVVPKVQIDRFEDLPEDLSSSLINSAKKIMRAMRKSFPEKNRIGVQIEGFEVPHAHIKLIPINGGAEFHAEPTGQAPDHEQLAIYAEKIVKKLEEN